MFSGPCYFQSHPRRNINLAALKLPADLKLADDQFFIPKKLDILLSSSLFFQVLNTKKSSHCSKLFILDTKFGNVIAGDRLPTLLPSAAPPDQCFFLTAHSPSLVNDYENIWNSERISSSRDENFSHLEHPCEKKFNEDTFRLENGQFCVSLPFKRPPQLLGNSHFVAKQFLLALENRFSKDRELRHNYVKFMREYIELGHAVECVSKIAPPFYFIPHFCVLNPQSPTTPLRVVFNCSAKSSSGLSLNDLLYAGPNVQSELIDIMLRFRLFNVCFTADIEKMYRMVRVHDADTKFQRILWRENPHDPIKIFTLQTVTYGMAPSAFLSTRCLNKLAEEINENDPEVASAIKQGFYVDDLLFGSDCAEKAASLFQRIVKVLKGAHFNLRKVNSNSSSFLATLNTTHTQYTSTPLASDNTHRILGLTWNTDKDTLCITYSKHSDPNTFNLPCITKRVVLHLIASIYDPLGFVNPFLVKLKLFLQKLWSLQLDWDTPLDSDLTCCWQSLVNEIVLLPSIIFPRKVLPQGHLPSCLVGFCDASHKAYGAALYLVNHDSASVAHSHLLCSKSRLAPLAGSTIPRLELCSALLLVELTKKVIRALRIVCSINQVYLFSDSSIVLHWLVKSNHKLDAFTAHRVSKIVASYPLSCWRHVSSRQNPADLLTRGVSPQALQHSTLWFVGPPWLKQPVSMWAKPFVDAEVADNGKVDALCCMFTAYQTSMPSSDVGENQNSFVQVLLSRYSKYHKLIRVLALCLRFINNIRAAIVARIDPASAQMRRRGWLAPLELREATVVIIRLIQLDMYPLEYKALSKEKGLPPKSSLLSLNPYLGPDGLLRVGGRLMNSQVERLNKHPIILPPNHKFTVLFLEMIHLAFLHAGLAMMMGCVRQQYWIPSLRRVAKKVINACLTCRRWRGAPVEQIMGSLPPSRVNPSRPWAHTSVDYCGPILTRPSLTRSKMSQKTWIAVFICHSTKASHLEIVENLSSSQFIAAFERFGSRRGYPVHMYSDNASTFKSASRILAEANRFVLSARDLEVITNFLSVQGTSWHFCPTYSPHRNSLAEACVKSLKFHLRRALGQQVVPLLTLYTLLAKIEACLNSRPLEVTSTDTDVNLILTPNHLVYGHALNTFPIDTDSPLVQITPAQQFRHLNNKLAIIWKYWSRNYLHTLQQRVKWKRESPPLAVNDLVLLIEESPPSHWKLGVVEKLFPDQAGVVRTVEVRTSQGKLLRPVQKLCALARSSHE